jgi:formylglycine-generating enzyme required for sulfatase activity/3',5'-cyclic AMP phosphodiesterase CpdA
MILILHLSDLHFGRNSRFADAEPEKLGKIFSQAVQDECTHRAFPVPVGLVIVTGDIAETAIPPEYETAQKFFEILSDELKLNRTRFVFAPGNHDVSWANCKRVAIDQEEEGFDEETLRQRMDALKFGRFEDFLKGFYRKERKNFVTALERGAFVHNFPDIRLSVGVLNSCELESHRKQDQRGYLSEIQAQSLMNYWQEKDAGIRVAAIHHNPFITAPANIEEWIKDFTEKIGNEAGKQSVDESFIRRFAADLTGLEGKEYLKNLAQDCQVSLLLHGHQHEDDQNSWTWRRKGQTCLLSAGSMGLKPEKLPKDQPNSAQLILLNPEEKEMRACTLVYSPGARAKGTVSPGFFVQDNRDRDCYVQDLSLPQGFECTPASSRKEDDLPPLDIPESYKDWITDRCRYMDIDRLRERGTVIQVKLPEIFIPLYAHPLRDEDEETGESERLFREKERLADIEDLIMQNDSLLIEGDPGSGKTTLMKHFAYSEILKTEPDAFLPVLIFLKDIKEFPYSGIPANAGAAENILSYYCETVAQNGLDPDTIKRFCKAGRAVLLIDGLDEIPRDLRDFAADAFAGFRRMNGNCKTVFSGRPHGIDGKVVDLFGDRHVKILSLNREQVEEFIRKWFCFVFEAEGSAVCRKTAAGMIAEIAFHPAIEKLTDTPLMLTAICLLYHDGKELPGQRAELYKKFIDNLLYKRFDDPEKVNRFLMSLALEMHRKGERNTDRQPALKILGTVYARLEGESEHEYFERLEKEFDRIEPNCGVLRFENRYTFWHLTFQEYLTAAALADREREDYSKAIADYWDDEWYREVIEMYVGYLSIQNMGMANQIVKKVLDAQDEIPFNRWRLAASALLDIHKDRREIEAIDLAAEKLRFVMDSGAAPKDRADAGEILGWLDDRRDLEIFIPIKGGTYELSTGTFEIRDFEIAKYPVTNRWFKRFVDDKGYENAEYWTEEGKKWLAHTGAKNPEYWHERKWNCPNAPVVGVCWYEAYVFCRWLTLTKDDGHEYRLPDENEWEVVAAGSEKREYPWGNEWDETKCNSEEGGIGKTSAVGIFKKGETPERVAELSGNVWEWTRSDYHSGKMLEDFGFETDIQMLWDEYEKSSGKDKELEEQLISKLEEKDRQLPVLRGGSWNDDRESARCADRFRDDPNNRFNDLGFRCVRTVIL